MNNHNNQIDQNFLKAIIKRISADYSKMAFLPNEITTRLLQRLQFIKMQPNAILNCAAKDGRISRELKMLYPAASILSHEIVKDFKTLSPDLNWLISPIQTLPLENDSVDMIICNLWLNNINDLAAQFSEFYRLLTPNGLLFFTMFGPDTLQELKSSYQAVSPYLHTYEFLDMHDIGDLLIHNQFADPVMDMENLTLTYSSVTQLFQDLRGMGGINARQARLRGLLGKYRYQKMIVEYENLRENNLLPATFEIIYGHAWIPSTKTRSKKLSDQEHVIPINRIQRRS